MAPPIFRATGGQSFLVMNLSSSTRTLIGKGALVRQSRHPGHGVRRPRTVQSGLHAGWCTANEFCAHEFCAQQALVSCNTDEFRAQQMSSVHSGRVLCTAGVSSVHSDAVARRFTHARSCCSCLLDCVARHTVNHKRARRKDHPAPQQEDQILCGGA